MRLFLVFSVWLTGVLLVQFRFTKSVPLEESVLMEKAVVRAQDWFRVIEKEKEARGIVSDSRSRVPQSFMIGDDYTLQTTTLGSLEAKEISTNPDFAALMVHLLHQAGCKKGDKAGLILSGSFPALGVSALAALQVMEMDVVMMSSLGASSYGANQPGATWIDMETWLVHHGMPYRSALVSAGAENDKGEGMPKEGLELIRRAAENNQRALYVPHDLLESIHYKTRFLEKEGIGVLINIGGNQAALGGCAHASSLPNGLHKNLKLCRHSDRGIIQEINALSIPVIHLLHIREMASDYGMDLTPQQQYAKSHYLYQKQEVNRGILTLALCLGLLATGIFLYDKKSVV